MNTCEGFTAFCFKMVPDGWALISYTNNPQVATFIIPLKTERIPCFSFNAIAQIYNCLFESLPKSVLGLASSCLNLSNRVFSLTVMGGAPEEFWSEMRAINGMMGRTGSDCCFCRVLRAKQ